MAKSRRISSRGALAVTDLALVDRLWTAMPAAEAIALVARPAPIARPEAVPGEPAPIDTKGLEVALEAFTTRRTLARPLAEALASKRATGIPWRWLTSIPSERDETRADERLLRWAEVTRVPEIDAGDVVLVTSAVERTMIGATEANEAFARWSSDAFVRSLEDTPDDLSEILLEAWDAPEPLMALVGVDEPDELWRLAAERVGAVREVARFARERSLALVPESPETLPAFLRARAAARAAR